MGVNMKMRIVIVVACQWRGEIAVGLMGRGGVVWSVMKSPHQQLSVLRTWMRDGVRGLPRSQQAGVLFDQIAESPSRALCLNPSLAGNLDLEPNLDSELGLDLDLGVLCGGLSLNPSLTPSPDLSVSVNLDLKLSLGLIQGLGLGFGLLSGRVNGARELSEGWWWNPRNWERIVAEKMTRGYECRRGMRVVSHRSRCQRGCHLSVEGAVHQFRSA